MRDSSTKPIYRGYEGLFAEWAESQGWDVTKRGWPDFICRRDGALMAVEVKGGADELSPEQIDALDDLSAAGLPTYVYHHGLGLKRWRRRQSESVANLKAEIGELHALIQRIVEAREGMIPGIHRPLSPDWSLQDELDLLIRWCAERHDGHERQGTRMTRCSWLYLLRRHERLPWDEIATILGEAMTVVRGHYRAMTRIVEDSRKKAAA